MKLLYVILYVSIIALVIFGATYIQEQLNAEIKAREELEEKIKTEARELSKEILKNGVVVDASIPDGDAITNDTINEADFNNVFEVKEQKVGSVRPTAQAIINLVAKTYNVDTATANRWLAQSFGELKAA